MIFFHGLTYKIRFMSLNIWDQEFVMIKIHAIKKTGWETHWVQEVIVLRKFNCQKSDYSNSFYRQAEGFTSKAMKNVRLTLWEKVY